MCVVKGCNHNSKSHKGICGFYRIPRVKENENEETKKLTIIKVPLPRTLPPPRNGGETTWRHSFARNYVMTWMVNLFADSWFSTFNPWADRAKLRDDVGLFWNARITSDRSEISAVAWRVLAPNGKISAQPLLHYAFSSWREKTMTKTIHFHWENRFVLQ